MTRPEAFTREEAAAELGCTEEEVRELLRAGELKTVACGIRPGLIPRHVLDAYLRRATKTYSRLPSSSGSPPNPP